MTTKPTLREQIKEKLDTAYMRGTSETYQVSDLADQILKLIEERIPKQRTWVNSDIVTGWNSCIAEMKKEIK